VRVALRAIGRRYEEWPFDFRQELERNPTIHSAVFRGDTFDMEERYQDAAAIFRDLCDQTTPSDGEDYFTVRVRLATTYDRAEEPGKALEILDQLLDAHGDKKSSDGFYWALYQKGVALVRLARYDEAEAILKPLQSPPSPARYAPSALHQLGVIDLMRRDFRAARKTFLQAQRGRGRDPNDHRRAFEHRRLGEIYARTERLDKAKRRLMKALEISDRCGNYRYVAKVREDMHAFGIDPNN
jgi:tetratricopeptide (TPR) repeat protein